MTILIAFHQSGYSDFKTYYSKFVCQYWQHYFPDLVSYTRMLKLLQVTLPLLKVRGDNYPDTGGG